MPSPDPALEMPRSVPADRSPSPRRATWIVILVVILAGALAAAVAWRVAERDAATRQRAAAGDVRDAVERVADDLVVALSGASVLIGVDGSVTQQGLERLVQDVSDAGTSRPVAWLTPVDTSAPAVEWTVQLSAAGPRAAPGDADALAGIEQGTVYPADTPLAAAATRALRSGRPARTLYTTPDGSARLAVLKPVYRVLPENDRQPIVLGVVMTADVPGEVDGAITGRLEGDVRYRVTDGDAVVAASDPAPSGGVTGVVDVDEQRLSTQVEDRRSVNHELSWFLLWITAVIVVAAGVVGLRSARYDRERRRTNAMIGRTAELAQHLALAATADEVAAVISTQVPALFDAEVASFGEVDEEAGVVRLHHGPDVDPAVADRLAEIRLGDIPTLADAVSDGSIVLLQDAEDWQRELPAEVSDRLLAAGARTAAVLPLEAPGRGVVATVGIIWWRPPRFDERTTATLETVRELCEQSLARAALTDRVSARASHLAELAERLAGVDTVADTARTVTSMALGVVGAGAASVGVRDDEVDVLRVYHGDTIGGRVLEVFSELRLDAPLAFTDAVRTGAPVMFPDLEAYAARYPDTDVANRDLGLGGRAAFPLRADDRVIGAIAFAWDGAVDFDHDLVNELTTVAEITAQSVRRAQLIEEQAADAERSRAMAELAQGLAARADTADIAGFLTESVLAPLGAVYSVVGVIDGDQLVRRYSRSLVETGLTTLGQDYLSSALESRTPATDAVRDGTTVFVTNRDEGDERYPEMAPVWDALGVHAGAAVPVQDRAGRIVASISVLWDRPIVVRDEMRDTLATVAGMVGQTLERTGLVDELRRSAERNQSMADFARALANVRSIEELCRSVVAGGARPVGAVLADVALMAEDGTVLPLDGGAEVPIAAAPEDGAGRPGRDPRRECLRRREVVVTPREELAEVYGPDTARSLGALGVQLVAHLPLVAPDGTDLGVLAVGWDAAQELSTTIRAKLRTLAELCSQTLQRTRLREAEHRLVRSLQERVVRPVPATAGLRIAERYLPASAQVGMGGDWFEGIELDDHRFAVVVGDIAGHGINAVADMVELRAIIGSLLRSATPLEEVYPQVAALLQQGGSGLTATSCTAVFDTTSDALRYVSAGHLPPVLARPDGSVELLEHGRQPLLGVPSTAVTPGSAPFPPGSVLAIYTDGIVERRRESIDVSLERLAAAMGDVLGSRGETAPDVEHVADELIERCLGGRPTDDDVALVVVARVGGGGRAPTVDRSARVGVRSR
ncbi:GAF domain-containing SpoIIE family protein phosphatase [Dermatobacter hominis]|uniref:GAF domain-containing SpoIIE family protein phosphatase n=1 Tax=Dermatobacter hominis TaxID=2884263 RepID=UPI001D10D758|nr:GAF domain-containing SpoIIE family protein phosphatase [Dermatobacter hominis]UDY35292.1 SpoIIE family protein phosphatase [Dermatobacter hominis]